MISFVLLFNYLDVVVNEKFKLRVIISYLNLWVDQEANIAFWNSAQNPDIRPYGHILIVS